MGKGAVKLYRVQLLININDFIYSERKRRKRKEKKKQVFYYNCVIRFDMIFTFRLTVARFYNGDSRSGALSYTPGMMGRVSQLQQSSPSSAESCE